MRVKRRVRRAAADALGFERGEPRFSTRRPSVTSQAIRASDGDGDAGIGPDDEDGVRAEIDHFATCWRAEGVGAAAADLGAHPLRWSVRNRSVKARVITTAA